MPRQRQYKAEYRRRIERGVARGLTRSQARGHARSGEPSVRVRLETHPDCASRRVSSMMEAA